MQIKSPVNLKKSGEFFLVLFQSKKPVADKQSENHTREAILGNGIFSAIFGEHAAFLESTNGKLYRDL